MKRRLLLATLGASVGIGMVQAEELRPAVRFGAIRIADDETARGQAPDSTVRPLPMPQPFGSGPAVTESRGTMIPAPAMPGATSTAAPTAMPSGVVTMGPAVPMTAAPAADGGSFPMPQLDSPLFAPGSPFTLANPNLSTHKFWVSAEYLYWWTKAATLPALVTTGPAASNGILGAPGTQTLLGGDDFGQSGHSGGRITLGTWFGNNQCLGMDVSYFQLQESGNSFAANSGQYPLLARPFTNLNQGIPFSQLTSYPGLATGAVAVDLENSLWGIDTNLRKRLSCVPCARLDALVGFRYLNFSESLNIAESFARTPNSPPSIGVPNAVSGTVVDNFSTQNDFYGGQLGLQGELRRGRWFVNGTAKVALGEMQQSVTISGAQSLLLTNGSTSVANGGLLALPGANIGTFSQNKFAVVPEVGLNLGYNLTPHLRAYVGYNFLYMSSVLRAADQIDTGLDVTRIPNFPVSGVTPLGTVRPTVPLRDSSMFVQGVNFGLQFSW